MNEPDEFSLSAVNRKRGEAVVAAVATPGQAAAGGPPSGAGAAPPGVKLPFDPLRLAAAVLARWKVVLVTALAAGLLGGLAGWRLFHTEYQVSARLMRQEMATTVRASELGEPFQPRQLSVPTIANLMKSATVLQHASETAKTRVPPGALLAGLSITPERNTDLITIAFKTALGPQAALDGLNAYGDEVVRLTRDMQMQEAADVNRFLKDQLVRLADELKQANQEEIAFEKESQFINADRETEAYLREQGELDLKYQTARLEYDTLDLRIAALAKELAENGPAAGKLQEAREQLAELQQRYTEENPLVQDQERLIRGLEAGAGPVTNQPPAPPRAGDSAVTASFYSEWFDLKTQKRVLAVQLEKLEAARKELGERLSRLPEKGMQYARLRARQQSLETAQSLMASRQREAQTFADGAPGYYRFFPAKAEEVAVLKPTKKRVLLAVAGAVFGALAVIALAALVESFDDRLKTAADVRRVAQLPLLASLPELDGWDAAARDDWAFRTWTGLRPLLAAGPSGTVVCGVLSSGAGEGRSQWIELLAAAAARREARVMAVTNRPPAGATAVPLADALASPAGRVPAPGSPCWLTLPADWRWTAEVRQRWQAAVERWQREPGYVLLLELPAAEQPETQLLAERLPRLLWLSGSGRASGRRTAELLETLRHAQGHLAGAVLNCAPRFPWPLGRAARLLPAAVAALWFAAGAGAWGAETNLVIPVAPAPAAPLVFAGTNAKIKAAWQQPLTLGPGDVVNFAFYGRPELNRSEVAVDPGGRITYLQAQDVMATGLTIDDLRETVTRALAAYYQQPHIVVTPVAFKSKKVFVLGKVVNKGAYTLDRPKTLLEVVAEAGGLETGLFGLNTVELADLPRSFVIRHGQRLPVDFEKLFNRGDLSQNILLEPDDYLYFPSAIANEIYVLGSVGHPGAQGLTSEATALSAVTLAGGFTPKAFKQRVLVVRGSLNAPQRIIVNLADVLAGRGRDFRLQPRDIVYVADRPWARVEDLADMAASAFIETMITTWTGSNVQPVITHAILPTP